VRVNTRFHWGFRMACLMLLYRTVRQRAQSSETRKGEEEMKTTPFKGVIENAYGRPLPTSLKYAGEFEQLEKGDTIPKDEVPKDSDILDYVNNKRKANARQKSMQSALTAAGIEKPTLENPEEQFKQMVKILVTAGKSEEDARQMANANLGTSY
jgi:hypothetical protein